MWTVVVAGAVVAGEGGQGRRGGQDHVFCVGHFQFAMPIYTMGKWLLF